MNPFSRTPIIITAIIAATLLTAGIIACIVFIPDSEGRITTILTITLPIALVQVVQLFNQRKLTATVQSNSRKLDTTVAQTNGIVNRLLSHVDGTELLNTSELAAIKAKVSDVRAAGAPEEGQ